MRIALAILLVGALIPFACGEGASELREGSFSALTYNVAGLPDGLKEDTSPETNTPLISPLLNRYDLVLVQEDFTYHDLLVAEVEHPHRSTPKEPERMMNDGLNRFAIFAFSAFEREMWIECFGGFDHGSDCLADKGFSVATHELAEGVVIDVYNLHLDASRDDEDAAVRVTQVDQLLAAMEARSAGRAVIVGGDTNLKPEGTPLDGQSLQTLLEQGGLADACTALDCGDTRIDRFLYRSSEDFTLSVTRWEVDMAFVDAQGEDLSDHEAVAVDFAWER